MSLINYVEPANIGMVFAGIGSLIVAIVLVTLIVRFCKPAIAWIDNIYHKDLKYSIVEEKMLDDIAKEKGIDLDGELLKRNILDKKDKNFRKKIEEQVFNKMFPEDPEDKK